MSPPDWVQLQEKSMIRWVNTKLAAEANDELPVINCPRQISDLNVSLQDGLVLIQITNQIIYQSTIENVKFYYLKPVYKNPKFKIQKMENLMDYLKFCQLILNINIDTISADNIYEGNGKLILGHIWSLFLFSTNTSMNISTSFIEIKNILKNWINTILKPRNLSISNFTKDWSSQVSNPKEILQAVFHHYHLKLPGDSLADIIAFTEDKLNLPHLIDIDDFKLLLPDEKSIVPFIVELFKYFEIDNALSTPQIEQLEKFEPVLEPSTTSIVAVSARLNFQSNGPKIVQISQTPTQGIQEETVLFDSPPITIKCPTTQRENYQLESEKDESDPDYDQSDFEYNHTEVENNHSDVECDFLGDFCSPRQLESATSTVPPIVPTTDLMTLYLAADEETPIESSSVLSPKLDTPAFAAKSPIPSTNKVEQINDLAELLVATDKLKETYQCQSSNFVNKVNSIIFELTSLLAISDPSEKLQRLVHSLTPKSLLQFSQNATPLIRQFNEMLQLLAIFDNYVINEKPTLFHRDFLDLVKCIDTIDANLEQIKLNYVPSAKSLSIDNVKDKVNSLIELELEIGAYIRPMIDSIRSIDLNGVLEILESVTIGDAKLINQCLDQFDNLFVITSKLDVYHSLFKLKFQPESLLQLLHEKKELELVQYSLNCNSVQQLKAVFAKNHELSHDELIDFLTSLDMKQSIMDEFVRMIPISSYSSQNDSDFELETSFASTSSVTSSESSPFDNIEHELEQIISDKVYDLQEFMNRVENGFST